MGQFPTKKMPTLKFEKLEACCPRTFLYKEIGTDSIFSIFPHLVMPYWGPPELCSGDSGLPKRIYGKIVLKQIFQLYQCKILPIKAALADRKKVVRGGFFLVFPFLVFEKSVVVAAMAAWAGAVQGQG